MTTAASILTIDDLAAPRLTELQRQLVDFAETQTVDWQIDKMLDEAVQAAGVRDSGGAGITPDFLDRVNAHIGAIQADEGSTVLSQLTLRERTVRLLRNRLMFADLLRRYPEIESIEIEKPFIVVGMPRTGTTHLVNLIARDPRRRALPYWESMHPFPIHGEGPGADGIDQRYARIKAEHVWVDQMLPYVSAMHHRFPEAIEEEIELLDLDFASYVLEWYAQVPGWRDYYLGLDQTQHYAYMKKVLQALTFLRGPRTWVLKSPQHSEQLPALMATFPDATVIFTHRDPVAAVQSTATMMAYGDRIRRYSMNLDWVIDYWTDRFERLLGACLRDRDLVPKEQSYDISFHQLNGNELSFLEKLYARNGVELTPEVRSEFEHYLADNPRGKHGQLRYNLQRDFQRDPDEIRKRFDFYFKRFDVQPETSQA
jgi:Sulfotransferase family